MNVWRGVIVKRPAETCFQPFSLLWLLQPASHPFNHSFVHPINKSKMFVKLNLVSSDIYDIARVFLPSKLEAGGFFFGEFSSRYSWAIGGYWGHSFSTFNRLIHFLFPTLWKGWAGCLVCQFIPILIMLSGYV